MYAALNLVQINVYSPAYSSRPDAAAGPAGCDLNQASRVPPFVGVTAAELARRAEVDLTRTK